MQSDIVGTEAPKQQQPIAEPATGLALEQLRAICMSFQDNGERLERIEERLNDRRNAAANQNRTVLYGVELGRIRLTIEQLSASVRQLEKRIGAHSARQ